MIGWLPLCAIIHEGDKMLRRVTKEEYQKHADIRSDQVSYCLECWKYFMSSTKYASLEAKPMGGMTANADGYGKDPHEAQLAQDTKVGAATNACIESLKPRLKWAIYKTLGIGQVIRFNFADLVETYDEATKELVPLLKKNFDTGYLF